MRKYILLTALVPVFAFAFLTPPAHANCWMRNGEEVCMKTSDGGGEAYTDARSPAMKQAQQRRVAEMLFLQRHRRIKNAGWSW
jgi:hypothetical protein